MGLLGVTPRARLRRLAHRDGASPLAGRTVLVTGASSGIGEATAQAAAARGAHVLLVALMSRFHHRVPDSTAARGTGRSGLEQQ